jgi:hypothetical protein
MIEKDDNNLKFLEYSYFCYIIWIEIMQIFIFSFFCSFRKVFDDFKLFEALSDIYKIEIFEGVK